MDTRTPAVEANAPEFVPRTLQLGALSRGQFFNYLPEHLTIVGDERFAAWVREKFGERGPKVLVDPAHPLYDPRVQLVFNADWFASLEALAQDILENKVEVAIGFARGEQLHGEQQKLVVYGRRRTLATALAILKQIEQGIADPLEWRRLPSLQHRGKLRELRLKMFAENDNRENSPPSVQAENVYRAVEQDGQALQVVANRMGKPKRYLERLLDLRECDDAVIRGVDSGKIPLQAVDDLRKLPAEKQRKTAERMASGPAQAPRAATNEVRAEHPEHTVAPAPVELPAPKPPPCRKRKELEAERDALRAALLDPKQDARRFRNETALAAILWVLGETDEPPSKRKPKSPQAGRAA